MYIKDCGIGVNHTGALITNVLLNVEYGVLVTKAVCRLVLLY